jgi:pimeloyl-ACP methyl ester carboxylesterase
MNSKRFLAACGFGAILTVGGVLHAADGQGGWKADPKLLEPLQKRQASVLYDESKVPAYQLPDPLLCRDGSRVSNVRDWEQKRRPETLDLFREYVYGRTPDKPAEVKFETLQTDEKAMEGKATLKRVKITCSDGGKSFAFDMALMIPNDKPGRAPCFVLINNRAPSSADPTRKEKVEFWPAEEIIARGYATAVFQTNDVDPDKNGEDARAKGVRGVWQGPGKAGEDAWATISAWAWGASRVMDYLTTDSRIDAGKVAVIGHSRGGKTALWAGAQDQRFALVISNDSGCGGAALSRRKFGETVALINKGFPYWFCGNFKKFNGKEEDLPIDQHQLMALIAPRALCVGSADADFWADQRGEFLAMVNAAPVYALYGFAGPKADELPPLETPLVRGRMDYHIRKGGHGLTLYDWQCYMDFADKQWK